MCFPLQYLQKMYSKDGPPLPVGEQLRRRKESEILRALHCEYKRSVETALNLMELAELAPHLPRADGCVGMCRAQCRGDCVTCWLWICLSLPQSSLSCTGPPSQSSFPLCLFCHVPFGLDLLRSWISCHCPQVTLPCHLSPLGVGGVWEHDQPLLRG